MKTLLMAIMANTAISAATVSLPASMDTSLNSQDPSASGGSEGFMIIIAPALTEIKGRVQFDLSGVTPETIINDATLVLTLWEPLEDPGRVAAEQFHHVVGLTSPWDEASTWNSVVHNGVELEKSMEVSTTTITFSGPQLTTLVQGWVDGSIPNYGLEIGMGTTIPNDDFLQEVFVFQSREGGVAPRLEFEVQAIPEPETPALLGLLGSILLLRRRK